MKRFFKTILQKKYSEEHMNDTITKELEATINTTDADYK